MMEIRQITSEPTMLLVDAYEVRPASMEDVDQVTRLLNVCSIEQTGQREWDNHELRADWQSPRVDLKTDTWVVVSPDGEFVGYADVWDEAPHVRIYGIGRVHPEHRGGGIGSELCSWLDERVRRSLSMAPEGARVSLLQSVPSTNEDAARLLQGAGYKLVRHFYQMVIDLETSFEPEIPDGLVIRTMNREQDLEATVHAVRDAFRDHWGHVDSPFEEDYKEWEHWIDNDPRFDPTLWFLAMAGDELAGVSLCSPSTPEDEDEGWVNVLGVRRPWRRCGLAVALLRHTFAEFHRRGKRRAGLGVDAESLTGATRLYEKVGMRVKHQFASYEKEIRPGNDLSTRAVQA